MHECAKYNERIKEKLIARWSENRDDYINYVGNTAPINISKNNKDLMTVILKCGPDRGGFTLKIARFRGISSVPFSP